MKSTTQSRTAEAMLGPVFVALNIYLLAQEQSLIHHVFLGIALIGLYASWQFPWKGVIAISPFLAAVLGYDFFYREDIWQIGLGGSLALSFIITALTRLEISASFEKDSATFKEQIVSLEQDALQEKEQGAKNELKVKSLQEDLQLKNQSIERLANSVESLQKEKVELHEKLNASLKTSQQKLLEMAALQEKTKMSFEQELQNAKKQLEKLPALLQEIEKKQALQDRITQLENEEKTKEKLQEERIAAISQEKKELQLQLDAFLNPELPITDLRCAIGLYTQLKEQFEEKKAALDNARKQSFEWQEKFYALERLKEEEHLEYAANMEVHIRQMEEILCEKEQELAQYEQLHANLVLNP